MCAGFRGNATVDNPISRQAMDVRPLSGVPRTMFAAPNTCANFLISRGCVGCLNKGCEVVVDCRFRACLRFRRFFSRAEAHPPADRRLPSRNHCLPFRSLPRCYSFPDGFSLSASSTIGKSSGMTMGTSRQHGSETGAPGMGGLFLRKIGNL